MHILPVKIFTVTILLAANQNVILASHAQRWTRLHIFQAPRSFLPLKHAKFLQSALSLFGAFFPYKLSNIAAFIEYIIGAFFTAMYKNS